MAQPFPCKMLKFSGSGARIVLTNCFRCPRLLAHRIETPQPGRIRFRPHFVPSGTAIVQRQATSRSSRMRGFTRMTGSDITTS